jgi:hypothetical protein
LHIDLDGDVDQRLCSFLPGWPTALRPTPIVLLWYLVDGYYNDSQTNWGWPGTIADIGADWGLDDPILSNRDKANPQRDAIPDGLRPRTVLRT